MEKQMEYEMETGLQGLGFRVQSLEFRFEADRFGVSGSGSKVTDILHAVGSVSCFTHLSICFSI